MIQKILICAAVFLSLPGVLLCQSLVVSQDSPAATISFQFQNLAFVLDYGHQCRISSMVVNGQQVLDNSRGIYSEVTTAAGSFSTLHLLESPKVVVTKNIVTVSNIKYGDGKTVLYEQWKFQTGKTGMKLIISRNCPQSFAVESASFPEIVYSRLNTWEGAFQGFGGIAWFYLFDTPLCTYGVHSQEASFWNSLTDNGLKVAVEAPHQQVAMKYTRTVDSTLAYAITTSSTAMVPRYDSGTHRRRYLRQATDVWAPFQLRAGRSQETISFSAFDYTQQYGRGEFKGVNGRQVTAVLNTIARMGVIDAKLFGGNSWHTPYGPICLHEQYIAQLGLGIDDPHYLSGYQQCLDFYCENAVKADGRVWPRWAYTNEDAMPGQFTDKGFYEAQWGYLMDSNPDFVTNVAELYNQTGDKAWVKKQQDVCERALAYLLKRDSNGNHLVEMADDNHTEKRSSDWIDIIWASYENAFVNAKLYHALRLWSDVEKQLGRETKAVYYSDFARKLKISFNKNVTQGGFWDDSKKYYVYWRDKDNSIHGDNLVTPVNFMAIAYGICEDTSRRNAILDQLETQMQQEHLFFWPISMYPYQPGDGKEYQFPFPYYENGDIFLSWGSLGVSAYAAYKPSIALQYVQHILRQDSIDGLAFQRYSRKTQDGQGDDILAGNSLAVVGLYQSIYGFNPMYNRFYLNPHITQAISGSRLYYHYRGQRLTVTLDSNLNTISNDRFTLAATKDFGFFSNGSTVWYFNKNNRQYSLMATTAALKRIRITIDRCDSVAIIWRQASNDPHGRVTYFLPGLPAKKYKIYTGKVLLKVLAANSRRSLSFTVSSATKELSVERVD